MKRKCVIMMSGGLDSTTILAKAKSENYEIFGLTFNYHQNNKIEIEYAKELARIYDIDHKIIEINLRAIGGSSLTDNNISVDSYNSFKDVPNAITSSYVPARNTVFLSIALSYAETKGAFEIFCGANKSDYNNYPDCRKSFFDAFEMVANLGTSAVNSEQKFKIQTPLIDMEKKDIIKLGLSLGVDYSKTISCYNPADDGTVCGICLSCTIRQSNFSEIDNK